MYSHNQKGTVHDFLKLPIEKKPFEKMEFLDLLNTYYAVEKRKIEMKWLTGIRRGEAGFSWRRSQLKRWVFWAS